jgi:Zn-dependent protease with chaperone function
VTAASAGQGRPSLAGLRTPPWLLVWLVYLLVEVPAMIGNLSSIVTLAQGTVPSHAGFSVPAAWWLPVLFAGLIAFMLIAGMVPVAFPQLRGRWVEQRFRLAADDRPVIAEMQRFVDSYDPAIRLRVSLRADQMARVYPVGWRSARIAVFRPLTVLWRYDREAAQAVLLHEVAHRRQGDQLITGLGSPLPWLIRVGAPAYLLLVLGPTAVFLADGAAGTSSFTAGYAATMAGLIPAEVFLPVIALWLAELNADRQAVQVTGPGALRRALQAGAGRRPPWTARAMALLSHPPLRLRLRWAEARPAGTAAVIGAWPVSVFVFVLVLPFVLDAADVIPGGASGDLWGIVDKATVQGLLSYDMPLIAATAVVLLAWPAAAGPWERLWSPGPLRVRHQPWWPSLAAASLPVGMVLLSLVPLKPTPQQFVSAVAPTTAPVTCAQTVAGWVAAGGMEKYDVAVEYDQFQIVMAGGSATAKTAALQRLDGQLQTALRNPPPGAARSDYITAIAEFRTATRETMDGDTIAAYNEATGATNLYFKSQSLLANAINPANAQASLGCYKQGLSPQAYQRMIKQIESAMCAGEGVASDLLNCP